MSLSKEFKVACQILEFNEKKEPIWFIKLTETLKMEPKLVMTALRTLTDWGMVKAEYGATSPGRAGRCLYVTSEFKPECKQIFDAYFKPTFANQNKQVKE